MLNAGNFLRLCSLKRVKEYFTLHLGLSDHHWQHFQDADYLEHAVESLPAETRYRFMSDADRIMQMADLSSHRALIEASKSQQMAELSTLLERSAWCFVHDPKAFKYAEDLRVMREDKRFNDCWVCYQVRPTPFICDAKRIEKFRQQLMELSGRLSPIYVDSLRSPDIELGKSYDSECINLNIYQTGQQSFASKVRWSHERHFELNQDSERYALVYCPVSGLIDVQSHDLGMQRYIAQCFADQFLTSKVRDVVIPRFDLSIFANADPLPIDLFDNIESIKPTFLGFREISNKFEISVYNMENRESDLYESLRQQYGSRCLITDRRFVINKVKLDLFLRPTTSESVAQVLSLSLEFPNRWNLRNGSYEEQTIAYNCLKQWSVIPKTL